MNNKITEGSITKQLMLFFLPILFGTFFQQLYNIADAAIVGHYLGKNNLSAVGGPTNTIINLLVGFFVGLSSGAGVVISQYFGAKNYEGAKKSIHTTVAIGIASGVVLTVAGIILSPILLEATGTPESVMGPANAYLRVYFAGIIFLTLYNMGSGILRAMGDSKRPLYFLIIACFVNIGLDILFIAVLKMGVEGAALGTIISQALSVVLTFIALSKMDDSVRFEIKKIRFDSKIFVMMLGIGIPAGMQSVLYSISNILIQSSINSFGEDTVAAWTAYGKTDVFFWMTLQSLGVAITTFVGQNFGANNLDRVKKSVRRGILLACTLTIALSSCILLFGKYYLRIFLKEPEVIEIAVRMIWYLVPFYITFVSVEIISGALRGTGDTIIPMIITCIGVCVLRVLWIKIGVNIHNTLFTVCLAYPITWAITSVAFIIYYLTGRWYKKHSLVQKQ